MTTTKRYSPKVRKRAVNLVLETQHKHDSQWKAIQSITPKIGCIPGTLRLWLKQHEQRLAVKNNLNADERQRLKEPERENRELRRSNDISTTGVSLFCPGGARPPLQEIASLTVPLMQQHGVESVCQELHIAPATYYCQRKRQQNPELRSARQRRDKEFSREIESVYDENKRLYGVKKVWLQLRREGIKVSRCTVERLMQAMGLVAIRRGKGVETTCSDKDAATLVNRQFMAERPNQL